MTDKRVALTDGDGKWFDPERATRFPESDAHKTGTRWHHEQLYYTSAGGWVLSTWSDYEDVADEYREISEQKAVEWLVRNEHDIPDALADIAAELEI